MPSQGLSLRDATLLDLAANNKSAEEMGLELGIDPARAVVRVKALLSSRDIWSDLEQKQLLLHSLFKLKEQLEKQSANYADPKETKVLLATISAINDILDKQGKLTEDQLTTITQTHARALVELVQSAFGLAEELLADKYPSVDLDEIRAAFQEGLRTKALEAT